MQDLGFTVNRLIRVSYGPFQLGQLKPGAVEEIRRRVMRDQLGLDPEDDAPKPLRRQPRGKAAKRDQAGGPASAPRSKASSHKKPADRKPPAKKGPARHQGGPKRRG